LLLMAGSALAEVPRVPCSCRYQGEKYGLGTVVCLSTPSGQRLARCEMMLNNTSWKFLSDGCPLTLQTPWRDRSTVPTLG